MNKSLLSCILKYFPLFIDKNFISLSTISLSWDWMKNEITQKSKNKMLIGEFG